MTQFRGLNCQLFDESGHAYLREDTSVWCDFESDEYTTLFNIDVPMMFVYQSIPIMYAAILIMNRKRLNPGFRSEAASRRKRGRDRVLAPYLFLFDDYTCSRWGFEVRRTVTILDGV